jgi:hypothetical protein
MPASEGAGFVGSETASFARGDHQHPRVSSSKPVTLDANGQGVATFSRPFSVEPLPAFAQMPPLGAGPCIFLVESWVMSGADYVGANVRGYRLSAPQNLATVQVLGISVAVGGQTVTTYGPANGVKVSVIMLPNSGA